MALEKTVITPHGFEALNAYHRVEGVSIIGKEKIKFHLRSYKSPEEAMFAELIIGCAYNLNGANPIKQAYEYVKTLPEWEDAIDC